ncbi:hypothetical protein K439DRAFT_1637032 [Ramaria rubella]|nr:hypothetical protein K439DRAFT_1637032 [Ramaria rubella]
MCVRTSFLLSLCLEATHALGHTSPRSELNDEQSTRTASHRQRPLVRVPRPPHFNTHHQDSSAHHQHLSSP